MGIKMFGNIGAGLLGVNQPFRVEIPSYGYPAPVGPSLSEIAGLRQMRQRYITGAEPTKLG